MANLLFTKSHEWIEADGDERKVGITDFAKEQLGDIVFVEFPQPGRKVKAGDEMCVIESTKATASVYSPVDGEIVEVNSPLTDRPELVNSDPTGDGWLVKVRPDALPEGLLDQQAYEAFCKEEE